MQPRSSFITVTDQFCGAGGSSLGAAAAGAEIVLAMNHDPIAIMTHNANFPNAMHTQADISSADPRRYPTTDVLITSPECTKHSKARGRKRVNAAQLSLWDDGCKINPDDERSRATMWDVPRFAEYHNYRYIIVENVVEAREWVPFPAWLTAMELLGYRYQALYLNSMFFHAPQSRDRMYIVLWRKGLRAPDLKFYPASYCKTCDRVVGADQIWKRSDKPGGVYGQHGQYMYRCPHCSGLVSPDTTPAYTAIDWAFPIERIGDRAKPLAASTVKRIETGLRKFGRAPFVASYYNRESGAAVRLTDEPLPTVTTEPRHSVVIPDGAFIVEYYGQGTARRVDQPLSTVLTKHHHALVNTTDALQVDDCRYRMFQPHEYKAAMAFPASYIVHGGKMKQITQFGNAVTPPVMQAIFGRVMEALR